MHDAAAGEAEIDFGGIRVAMIGADLAGLPTGDRDVAVGYFAEDFLDVVLGVPLLFAFEAKDVHFARFSGGDGRRRLAYPGAGQERDDCTTATRVDRRFAPGP
jgi:hypothetical protein